MNNYFDAEEVTSNTCKLLLVVGFLQGEALDWHRAMIGGIGGINRWVDYEQAIQVNFQPTNAEDCYRDNFANLKQTGSVKDFNREFRRVVLKCKNVSEEEMFDKYKRSLRKDIQKELVLK